MLTSGDDSIRIIVETGKLRAHPQLGTQFSWSKSTRRYVNVSPSDFEAGFVRGQCIAALNEALNEITENLR